MKRLAAIISLFILCLNNCSSEQRKGPKDIQRQVSSDSETRACEIISDLASPGRWPWVWQNGGPNTLYTEEIAELLNKPHLDYSQVYNSLGSESEKAYMVCAIVDLHILGCERIVEDYLKVDGIRNASATELPIWHQFGVKAAKNFQRNRGAVFHE